MIKKLMKKLKDFKNLKTIDLLKGAGFLFRLFFGGGWGLAKTQKQISIAKNSKKEDIQIYNSIGQLVKEISVYEDFKIDISNFDRGIYFIKSKNYQTIKFIKK